MLRTKNPYQQVQRASETQRDFELRVFRQVTFALQKAHQENDTIALVRAATNNYLLWQTLLNDVTSDDNKLPRDLRRSIAIVAKAVSKEIDENINGTLDVEFLVNINNNIIEGLATTAPGVPTNVA